MKARYLGHVVFYVKDLERSLQFYRDLLGFKEIGKTFGGTAAALTSGRTHHELLLIEVEDASPLPLSEDPAAPGRARGSGASEPFISRTGPRREVTSPRVGLYHIGIKIGDSLDDLRAAKAELDRAGVRITGMSDHTVSQSLYLKDPDGNEVEVYVDADPKIWERDPAAVLSSIKPLRL
jgi:catechol 2,3-dioxygenase